MGEPRRVSIYLENILRDRKKLMKGEPILQKSSKRLGNPRKRSAYL